MFCCVNGSVTGCGTRFAVRLEHFGNIFVPLIAQGLGHFVLKFCGKIRRGSCKLNTRGYEN